MASKPSKKKLPKKSEPVLALGALIRSLRQAKKLSGVELCRLAGGMDPRLLNAVEKGRIQSPSLQTLTALSRALGMTLAGLFTAAEIERDDKFFTGSQKGNFMLEFPAVGARVVSFTPFTKDFFCGKVFLGAKKKFDQTLFRHAHPQFVSVILGRFEIDVGGRQANLREGENLFFHGAIKHRVMNPLHRESVLMLMTAPSFL